MTTINDALRGTMEKAVSAAETAVGQKAAQMILVTETGSPIHYQFGIGFDIGPDDNLTPKTVTDAIEAAFKSVGDFIASNCRQHFVRVAPSINTDRQFDTKAMGYRGFMRGAMIEVGDSIGPAKLLKPGSLSFEGFGV